MRFVFGKVAALAVASVLATAAVVGCSSTNEKPQAEDLGSVGMHLKMGPGVTVNAVTLTVTDPLHPAATPVMVRTIPSPGDGSDFNFAVSLPPSSSTAGGAGNPYHAHLEAHSVVTATMRHAVTCLGDANFTVIAGQTATASITLVCDDDLVNGDQKFNVTVDSHVCPLYVDFASTSPTTVQAQGGVATLAGSAHDETSNPETSGFTYAWSAPAGSGTITPLGTNSSADATFTCGNPNNNVVLTLTATRLDQGCSDSISVFVNCASALCGNGTVNPGETCDDGNTIDTDACPADCTFSCGDGVREGNEQCDPPSAATHCGTLNGLACQVLPYCGDGHVDAGETCDDGNQTNTDSCTNACKTATCGDGFKQGTEQCDDGNTNDSDSCRNDCTTPPVAGICGDGIPGNVTGGTDVCDEGFDTAGKPVNIGHCTQDCKFVTKTACSSCENSVTACKTQVGACDLLTGNQPSDPDYGDTLGTGKPKKQLCNAVLECARRTNCGNIASTDCWCGIGADTTKCQQGLPSGAPTGPCKDEIAAALNVSNDRSGSGAVFSRFVDPTYPGGTFLSLLACDRANCAGNIPEGQASNLQCYAP